MPGALSIFHASSTSANRRLPERRSRHQVQHQFVQPFRRVGGFLWFVEAVESSAGEQKPQSLDLPMRRDVAEPVDTGGFRRGLRVEALVMLPPNPFSLFSHAP